MCSRALALLATPKTTRQLAESMGITRRQAIWICDSLQRTDLIEEHKRIPIKITRRTRGLNNRYEIVFKLTGRPRQALAPRPYRRKRKAKAKAAGALAGPARFRQLKGW